MNKVTAPIRLKESSDAVQVLQQALQALGFKIKDTEIKEKTAGETTFKSVRTFQDKFQINFHPDLLVDESTAEKINKELEKPIADTITYKVQGMLRDKLGQGMKKVSVVIMKKDFRKETEVASAKAFQNGFYETSFQLPTKTANIQVVVLDEKKNELMRSQTYFDIKPETWINIMEGGGEFQGHAEFDVLMGKISPVIGKTSVGDLTVDEKMDDVSYLAKELQIPSNQIIQLIASFRLSQQTKISPEAFYSFFRQNQPANVTTLEKMRGSFKYMDSALISLLNGIVFSSPQTQKDTLLNAIRQNLVAPKLEKQLDNILARFSELLVQLTAERPFMVAKTPLKSIIGLSNVKPKLQEKFLVIYANHNGDTRSLWQKVKEDTDFAPDDVRSIRKTFAVGLLTKNQLPMMENLLGKINGAQPVRLSSFAKKDENEWAAIIKESTTDTVKPYPYNIHGTTEEEKILAYASMLRKKFERTFPTTAFIGRIEKDKAVAIENKPGVLQFLSNAAVNLKSANIESIIKNKAATIFNNISEDQKSVVIREVKKLQRIMRLAPNIATAKVLLDQNYHSSQQIYFKGKNAFIHEMAVVRHSPPLMKVYEANAIYNKAATLYAVMLSRYAEYNGAFNNTSPAVVPVPEPSAAQAASIGVNPNLKALFGSMDFCSCEHCSSVYSPAAYLVDLLQFLKNRPAASANPKNVLLERRPDLGTILLNCDNTNVPLPYIDLVNEILEDTIAKPVLFPLPKALYDGLPSLNAAASQLKTDFPLAGIQLSSDVIIEEQRGTRGWLLKDNGFIYSITTAGTQYDVVQLKQTYGTEAELKAHPYYINSAVYNTHLKNPVNSFKLPFDLWSFEGSTYLAHLGINRYELMELFQDKSSNPKSPKDSHIAAEYVGMSRAELDIVTITDIPGQPVYWNTANPVVEAATVSKFLEITEVTYQDLLDLLNVSFINSGAPLSSIDPRDICDTSKQTITNLTTARLDLFNRFIRLWRKTGWSIPELNLIIHSAKFGNDVISDDSSPINKGLISKIKVFKQLQARLKLSVEQLLAFYQDINTVNYSTGGKEIISLYASLFQNKTITNPVDVKFSINAVTNAATTELLKNNKSTIQAALLLEESDLDLLIPLTQEATDAPGATPYFDFAKLTLRKLSILYRYAAFAQSLQLSIKDLIQLIKITSIADIFNSSDDTADFLTKYDLVKTAKTSIDQLSYILLFDNDDVLRPLTEEIGQMIEQLRTELQKSKPEKDDLKNTLKEKMSKLFGLDVRIGAHLLQNYKLAGSANSVIDNIYNSALDAAAAKKLLEKAADGTYKNSIDETNFAVLFESFYWLHKIVAFIGPFKLKIEELEWLATNDGAFQLLSLNSMPYKTGRAVFTEWQNCINLISLRNKYPAKETNSIFSILSSAAAITQPQFYKNLRDLTLWSKDNDSAIDNHVSEFDTIHTKFGLNYPADYQNTDTYKRLEKCFAMINKVGVKADRIIEWSKPDLSNSDAIAIKQTTKSRYSNDQWLEISTKLQNKIRERKRDALVAYLLAHPKSKVVGGTTFFSWSDAASLYSYFLIYVEMSSCQPTTRILQANAALQLFIQRCRMNLETPDVVVNENDDGWLQWAWMKNYRVWEANRKVFLYPENWIEPELRDNKTPFFKELETQLLQNEITNEYAEETLEGYVEKLYNVRGPKVSGMYHEVDGLTDITHVFAQTEGIPPTYYNRKYIKNAAGSYWTAWERVELDINSEQIAPIIYNRKLHVFWLVFSEKPNPSQKIPVPKESTTAPPPAKKYWEIQLAWSVYKNGKWTPKKISEEKLLHPWFRPKSSFNLRASISNSRNEVLIDIFINDTVINWATGIRSDAADITDNKIYDGSNLRPDNPWHSSQIVFNGKLTEVRIANINNQSISEVSVLGSEAQAMTLLTTPSARKLLPPKSQYYFNYLVHSKDDPGSILCALNESGNRVGGCEVLYNACKPYYLTLAHQDLQFDSNNSFFYSDNNRSYFVKPKILYQQGSRFTEVAPSNPSAALYMKEYTMYPFYHPFTDLFIHELNRWGIKGILNRDIQLKANEYLPTRLNDNNTGTFHFSNNYRPSGLVKLDIDKQFNEDYNTERVDFTYEGSYSIYNWELFFHVPMLIANKLSTEQRFEDAMKWYHYIFDPTIVSGETSRKKYWKTKPFFLTTDEQYLREKIDRLLLDVAKKDTSWSGAIDEWRKNPFNPHLIARTRTVAYQKNVVKKYIDNLFRWADSLANRDTYESVNEAMHLYVLIAAILGPEPVRVPREEHAASCYNELEEKLDAFGNALLDVENTVIEYEAGSVSATDTANLPNIDALYFCIPPNDNMLDYWKKVKERLYNLSHCRNIRGEARQIRLFEPPLDPGALVRAVASGMDLSSALSDISVGLPNYRFRILVQKATEFCQEVKALGAMLLSVLEKTDAEKLALLRSAQEVNLLEKVKEVRQKQLHEANFILEVTNKTIATTTARKDYYDGLLKINETLGSNLLGGEQLQKDKLKDAKGDQDIAQLANTAAAFMNALPSFSIGFAGFGGSPSASISFGGANLGALAQGSADFAIASSNSNNFDANMAFIDSGHERRNQEWTFQRDNAIKEGAQWDQQKNAADMRRQISEKELSNHELQMENAKRVDEYMHEKYTNQELYDWMMGQVSSIYFQSYQLAYDMAKKAEKCMQYELGVESTGFIQFGYWDSLKKGLLSGERLFHDIKRMESEYLELNKRELELTKHVSLSLVDPLALLILKQTGKCIVSIPEEVFNMDYPGHYFRRIKSVSISIPCITGPFTSVSCTLTLTKNSYRKNTDAGAQYEHNTGAGGDTRFVEDSAATQSIATSHAQNDTGMFEFNFNDDRYLPFEGGGAVSTWSIELNNEFRQFDFETITDVILHMKYTARDGGDALKVPAVASFNDKLNSMALAGNKKGLMRIINVKHEFSTEWYRFLNPVEGKDQELKLPVGKNLFPFFAKNFEIKVNKMEIGGSFSQNDNYDLTISPLIAATKTLSKNGLYGDLHQASETFGAGKDLNTWTVKIKKNGVADFKSLSDDEIGNLFIILYYKLSPLP